MPYAMIHAISSLLLKGWMRQGKGGAIKRIVKKRSS